MILRSLFFLVSALALSAEERPNIVWITSEDNDKDWLGCYGNEQAQTPHLDALAKRSVRFENFFSNAPVCAVARSTIINGVYAPTQGTQHMRSRHAIPAANTPYPSYLKAAGYYTTNASKTDYNFAGNDKALWDECGSKAHYKNRAEGQPFFAIFNLTESHESSLFASKIASNRKKGKIPQKPRVSPEEVQGRPYLPDLPEVRHDLAVYHDNITLLDQRVGDLLQELDDRGLAEDTIIFYYADHGGITPRGKRYLKDTGVNVPLLIHVPNKWQQLAPFAMGSVTEELASFVDLAPTVLSLLDAEQPARMPGRAFMGRRREEPKADDLVFLFADRFDEIYGMRRGVTDGRWKYIRRFTPQDAAAPYSYYQFGQQAWTAWREASEKGSLEPRFDRIWKKEQAVEELFDTQADHWEVKNLANDPEHSDRLEAMRAALQETMAAVRDSGLIPEPMFAELSPNKPIAKYVAARSEDWGSLVEFAFLATARDSANLPRLLEKLTDPDPLLRYWAIQGCLILGPEAQPAVEPLRPLLSDAHSANRAAAARALIALGQEEGCYEVLLRELESSNGEYAQLNAINLLTQLKAEDRISDEWVRQSRSPERRKYVQRLAQQLSEQRGLK